MGTHTCATGDRPPSQRWSGLTSQQARSVLRDDVKLPVAAVHIIPLAESLGEAHTTYQDRVITVTCEDGRYTVRASTPEGTWDALVAADEQRNAGMSVDLMAAAGYAERQNQNTVQYIIDVLRAERERRQEEDRAASDRAMADMVIDGAHAAGMSIVDYVISGTFIHGEPRSIWDISPEFLGQLVSRCEERMRSDDHATRE